MLIFWLHFLCAVDESGSASSPTNTISNGIDKDKKCRDNACFKILKGYLAFMAVSPHLPKLPPSRFSILPLTNSFIFSYHVKFFYVCKCVPKLHVIVLRDMSISPSCDELRDGIIRCLHKLEVLCSGYTPEQNNYIKTAFFPSDLVETHGVTRPISFSQRSLKRSITKLELEKLQEEGIDQRVLMLKQVKVADLARALYTVDFAFMKAISPSELLEKRWTKPNKVLSFYYIFFFQLLRSEDYVKLVCVCVFFGGGRFFGGTRGKLHFR